MLDIENLFQEICVILSIRSVMRSKASDRGSKPFQIQNEHSRTRPKIDFRTGVRLGQMKNALVGVFNYIIYMIYTTPTSPFFT